MSRPRAVGPQPDTSTFWRKRELPGVELWCTPRSADLLRAVFPGYALTSSSGPAGRWMDFRYRASRGRARGDDVAMLEPDEQIHQLASSGPMRLTLLTVTSTYARDVARGEGSDKAIHLNAVLESKGALYPLIDRLAGLLRDPHSDPLDTEHHARTLIRAAFATMGEERPRVPAVGCARAVRRALDLVRSEFASRLTLTNIAREAGVSTAYLERSFTQMVGTPVHQYVKGIRVARALELMSRGCTAADAAAAVGFVDQPHMTTVFRKRMGFTPGQYCRQINRARPVSAPTRSFASGPTGPCPSPNRQMLLHG
jgi:AraC-like DNA-binding protein